MFNKNRLEALSDGIFAIVMTLLVLDLKVPDGPLPQHFGAMLAQQWLSFFITFLIASTFWTLQHRVFGLIRDIHQKTLIPTFIFLGFVSVLPFSTSLLGHRLRDPISFRVYYANQMLIAAALYAKLHVAKRLGEVAPGPDFVLLRMRLLSMCAVMLAGFVGAFFLPARWTFAPAFVLAVIAKRLRHAKAEALAAQ